MPITVLPLKKPDDAAQQDGRARQIDELQRISSDSRGRFLGEDYFRTCHNLYNVLGGSVTRPFFRPTVQLPFLQLLTLNEAADLAELNPKVMVYSHGTKNKREREREQAFQDQWKQQGMNVTLLFEILWARYAGTAFAQVGYDHEPRNGQGQVWCDWINPQWVYPDPAAKSDKDWSYVVVESRMYIDEIRRRWPEHGAYVRPHPAASSPTLNLLGEGPGYTFEMPPGPLSYMPGAASQARQGNWDGRVRVRTLFADDYSIEVAKDKSTKKALEKVLKPTRRPKYANGRRMVIEAGGVILADGDIPIPETPSCRFPVVPLWSLPNITSFWCPPMPRFAMDIQELAARMLSQTFENAVRLNNGIWFIDSRCGIDAEDFGGLPGEVRIINSGSPIPEIKWPPPMPPHMVQMPEYLLGKVKELMGFTVERQGKPGAGNVSAGLYDASVYQAQYLTRLASMLLADHVQKLTELQFYTMARFYTYSRYFPSFAAGGGTEADDDEGGLSQWEPVKDDISKYSIYLDPGSVRALTKTGLRQMVLALRQAGLIDAEHALDMLEVPDAETIAKNLENEERLAALAKIKRR
jgi:hypothetical protein